MRLLKSIGVFLLILITFFTIWFVLSFIDIASKNHISDSNYKGYHRWNLIIITNDYCLERG
jgi:hypothetical protein